MIIKANSVCLQSLVMNHSCLWRNSANSPLEKLYVTAITPIHRHTTLGVFLYRLLSVITPFRVKVLRLKFFFCCQKFKKPLSMVFLLLTLFQFLNVLMAGAPDRIVQESLLVVAASL